MREHRFRLPEQLRALGDDYVKNEFKLHKNARPEFLNTFFKSWNEYLLHLRSNEHKVGRNLTSDEMAILSKEQVDKVKSLKTNIHSTDDNN